MFRANGNIVSFIFMGLSVLGGVKFVSKTHCMGDRSGIGVLGA